MRELIEISAAFEALCGEGRPSALATVVRTEGSSYRRPGARMLIAEDGRTWGGVSGGCLERDVVRRAIGAMASGRTSIARYDTSEDEQLAGGVSTGCGGAIEILIQPLSAEQQGPMPYLARVLQTRKSAQIVSVVHAREKFAEFSGRFASREALVDGPCNWPFELRATAIEQLDGAESHSTMAGILRDSSSFSLFVEMIHPPQHLVIFGAGPDVVPVVTIAKTLGWRVTVVGSHPATQIFQRFPTADALHVTDSADPSAGVEITRESAVLVMTHNIARDAAVLLSLQMRPRYLGVLGPKHRTERLLNDWPTMFCEGEVYAPVGLDLGAETPEEIALSILSEIQKVLRHATGQSLRELQRGIHDQPIPEKDMAEPTPAGQTVYQVLSCGT